MLFQPKWGLQTALYGRDIGNFNLLATNNLEDTIEPPEWEYNLEAESRLRGLSLLTDMPTMIVARPKFISNLVLPTDDLYLRELAPKLKRARRSCDAILVEKSHEVIVFCNADCLMGVLWHPAHKRMIVMHLGLDCLVPPDGSPSLLEVSFQALSEDPSQVWLWLGAMAGPCCLGYHPGHVVLTRVEKLLGPLSGLTFRGPRKGQVAVDQMALAVLIARQIGIRHIVQEYKCTSCAGKPSDQEQGTYFSNLRDGSKTNYRNAFLAWML